MATPVLGVLLVLGGFPSAWVMGVGILTAFAGYTAVYALNDVVDYRADMEKIGAGGIKDSKAYLDDVMPRHPMATGVIGFSQGVLWVVFWSILAITGAYLLNPVCAWIFLGGICLEVVYCRLWKVTPFRSLVNGVVKACGPVAAVFAVTPDPPFLFTIVLFLWIFFWEIGGQNIPADWTDMEEDRRFQAQTIPVRMGTERAAIIALVALILSFLVNVILFFVSPLTLDSYYFMAIVAANFFFLLWPVSQLCDAKDRASAITLFNRASYYPLAILSIVLVRLSY
jgi:4-hydroxybenzoate polyprenyltransferase